MKKKLTGIFIILASLSAVSCRETEEFSSASSIPLLVFTKLKILYSLY